LPEPWLPQMKVEEGAATLWKMREAEREAAGAGAADSGAPSSSQVAVFALKLVMARESTPRRP
jgi:hypothetical protein